mgnify:CR=1 FL=1|tara:strand:+ start:12537 stop:13937 length:1401 start_codon:yes stop_codon:yes gene_type:complete
MAWGRGLASSVRISLRIYIQVFIEVLFVGKNYVGTSKENTLKENLNKGLPPLSDPFSPLVLMSIFSFFGFVGVLFFVTFSHPEGVKTLRILSVTYAEVLLAFGFFLVYYLFWFFGYIASRKSIPRGGFFYFSVGRKVSSEVSAIIFFVLILMFWISYKFHPAADNAFRSSLTSGSYGMFFFFLMTFTLAFFGVFTAKLFADNKISVLAPGSWSISVVSWAFGVFFLALVVYSLGGRGRVVSIFIVAVAVWHYYVRPIGVVRLQIYAVAAICVIIFMPVIANSEHYAHQSIWSSLWGVENGRTFDGLYNLTRIINWWSEHGVWGYPGELLVGDVSGDLGISGLTNTRDVVMLEVYGKSEYSAGFPATKPGELLLNFGLIGVPVGAIILGYISGKLYYTCVVNKVFGFSSIPIYIMVLMRTGIASPLGYFGQNLVMSATIFFVSIFIWVVFFGGYRIRRAKKSFLTKP